MRLSAHVYGYVQGVSFRYYARQRAQKLGLRGYVRNCADGSVEVVAEGPRRALDELQAWLQRGPSMAEVDHVDVTWEDTTGEWASFEVRY
jgi:acylphosphatase